MRKFIVPICIFVLSLCSQAREAYVRPGLGDNWAVGLSVGAASPLKGHSFFTNMRPSLGVNLDKHLTPAFALGAEVLTSFNSSRWPGYVHSSTAFDNLYAGVYGSLDLVRLASPACGSVPVGFGLQAGCGWGHDFHSGKLADHNYFATKVGLFLRFNVTPRFAVSLSPSVVWDMSDASVSQSSAAYSASKAAFSLQAGIRYSFGPGFTCPQLYDTSEVNALNGQINSLRADLITTKNELQAAGARAEALATELKEAREAKPEVVKEVMVNNRHNTVLDVFFLLGSANITPDQMPNVERIAHYLKNHPGSTVVIKGYASRDGNAKSNEKLASMRAEAVKTALIKKYGISASRISASGAGIGDMFEDDAWNRVSICTLEN